MSGKLAVLGQATVGSGSLLPYLIRTVDLHSDLLSGAVYHVRNKVQPSLKGDR